MKELSRRDFVRLTGLAGAAGAVGGLGVGGHSQTANSDRAIELPLTVPIWTRSEGYYPPLVGLDPERRFTPFGVPDDNGLMGGLSPELIDRAPTGAPAHRVIDPDTTRLKPEYHSPVQHPDGGITPNGLTYIIAHGRVPIITRSEHRLVVHGDRLASPKIFTMEDLRRFPSVTATHFLECAGNTYQAWAQNSSPDYADLDVQLSHGLLSGVRWTGVPVRHVLRSCGIRWSPGQRRLWVLAEGADGSVLDRSIPIEKMMDDALIAFEQNGRPLQRENGYPIRLILPGYEGNTNVKWLRRLKVGTEPWMTKEETSGYTDYVGTAGRGGLPGPGLSWQFTLPMEVKSVITRPAGGQRIEPPRPGSTSRPVVNGLAWSGRGKITRVEVRVGDGPWADAVLPRPEAILPMALTPFAYRGWTWDGGQTWLSSRAWDDSGMVQVDFRTLASWRGVDSVYHYNAIQTWRVEADGRVLNHAQTI